uniref:Uncharacterized protein n=1 Tax=Mesocestoides corti TaxID=53468 RepID=A0A5K3EMP7_MESCO
MYEVALQHTLCHHLTKSRLNDALPEAVAHRRGYSSDLQFYHPQPNNSHHVDATDCLGRVPPPSKVEFVYLHVGPMVLVMNFLSSMGAFFKVQLSIPT